MWPKTRRPTPDAVAQESSDHTLIEWLPTRAARCAAEASGSAADNDE
jgi:hypothetical protein